MSSPSKPDKLPRWANTVSGDTSRVVEPNSGKKDVGYAVDEQPPCTYENWLKLKTYQWLKWCDDMDFAALSADNEFTGANQFDGTTSFNDEVDINAALVVEGPITADAAVSPTDDDPVMSTVTPPTNRRLMWEVNLGDTMNTGKFVYLRLYAVKASAAGIAGCLEATINARWDAGTSKWVIDDNSATRPIPTKMLLNATAYSPGSRAGATAANLGRPFAIFQYLNTATWTDVISTNPADAKWNVAIDLDPTHVQEVSLEGVVASGAMTMSIGAYHQGVASDQLGNYAEFRKAYPSAPSSATYLATIDSNLITSPSSAGSYTLSTFSKWGMLATAVMNGTGAGAFQIEILVNP